MSFFRRRPKPSVPDRSDVSDVDVALAYHKQSKHDFHRFAASMGFLDWDSQPDPFRRYEGAPQRALDLAAVDAEQTTRFDEVFAAGAVAPRSLDAAALSHFLFHALALSAGKRVEDSSWSLRVNPSSGNLHPTEGWLILPPRWDERDGSDPAALWHYAPYTHALEQRATLRDAWAEALFDSLPDGAFLVALSSIAWREGWKYGERAYRYVNHDVGHALGALRYAAALCGWTLSRVPSVGTERLAQLLGLDLENESPEAEMPDLLAVVRPVGAPTLPPGWTPPAGVALDALRGSPNVLSSEHHEWPVLAAMETLCRDPGSASDAPQAAEAMLAPIVHAPVRPPHATQIIRGRRSAVSMDRTTRLSAAAFYRMLAATHPALSPAPFDALAAPARVHLFLFVHRVDDVIPGLYLLTRDESGGARLRDAMDAPFVYTTPPGCPAELPLVLLHEDDARNAAARVSCGQDIAADGAFSLGMLAELEPTLRAEGPSAYPRLYWETGLIGQVLYLQAHAAGVSATGIGCFFDNPVHALAGLTDARFQSLYHFTVGGAVPDGRIVDEPPYAHLG